jgi:hypothetical protein
MGACCSSSSAVDEPPLTTSAAAAGGGAAPRTATATTAAVGRPLTVFAATAVAAADGDPSEHRAAVLRSVRLGKEKPTRNYTKPRWRAAKEGIASRQQLERLRQEYWDTAPAFGGAQEAWAALRAAAEAPDLETTRLILDAAGLIVVRPDLTVVYDERGARYELPVYVLSEPEDGGGLAAFGAAGGGGAAG